jgi:hypothetical protein
MRNEGNIPGGIACRGGPEEQLRRELESIDVKPVEKETEFPDGEIPSPT